MYDESTNLSPKKFSKVYYIISLRDRRLFLAFVASKVLK